MEEKEVKPILWLKWPWNVLIYISLALLLRLWAIPVILGLMALKKKHEPKGPEEGYCLQRCRNHLTKLGWTALFFALGACVAVYIVASLEEVQYYQETEEYIKMIAAAVFVVGFFVAGIYEAYVALRDAICPGKSGLAKAIRSQMPYPDEAPDVRELFAMVDEDIAENGQWFDKVAVGKRWVFGDVVADVSRIRVVFWRNEKTYHQQGGRTRVTQVIQMIVLDDRRQEWMFELKNPKELPMLLDCVKLRAPDAIILPYDQHTQYRKKSDEEWEKVLREYRRRKGQRETLQEYAEENGGYGGWGGLHSVVLPQTAEFGSSGTVNGAAGQNVPGRLSLLTPAQVFQSHDTFERADVQVVADGLVNGTYQAVNLLLPGGCLCMDVAAGNKNDGRCLVQMTWPVDGRLHYYKTRCGDRQAAEWLMEYYDRRFTPNWSEWKEYTP